MDELLHYWALQDFKSAFSRLNTWLFDKDGHGLSEKDADELYLRFHEQPCCDCEFCIALYLKHNFGLTSEDLEEALPEDFIDRRGFAMRRGHRDRVVHSEKATGRPGEVLPGRSSFKRRAGGHRDVVRCSMCKPGRHHGAGGAKSLKKVKGSKARAAWLDVMAEVRRAELHDMALFPKMATSETQSEPAVMPSPDPENTAKAVPAVPVPPVSWGLPLAAAKCQCAGCPQRKRRFRFLKPERTLDDEKDYEVVMADLLNNIEETVGDEWVLLA